jgi:8-oxo-dGTP pyrophosphatase MutT (NUDIX family)
MGMSQGNEMAAKTPRKSRTANKPRVRLMRSAGAIVFYRGAEIEYLLIRFGHWEFPKGMVDEDEDEETAAQREVREETGLDVRLLPGFCERLEYFFRLRESGALVKKTVAYFLGEATTREVRISWEHKEALWVPYERALELLPYENMRAILRQAHAFLTRTHQA